jgi:hypothetical protein
MDEVVGDHARAEKAAALLVYEVAVQADSGPTQVLDEVDRRADEPINAGR